MESLSTIRPVKSDAPPVPRAARPGVKLTLRGKGIIALAALVVYVALVALYVGHERARLLDIVQRLEHLYGGEELLIKVNAALTHSIVTLQDILDSPKINIGMEEIAHDISAFSPHLPNVRQKYPETVQFIRYFERRFDEFSSEPSRRTMLGLRNSEQQLSAVIEDLENGVQGQSQVLSEEYRALNRNMTVGVTVMNLFGLVFFGMAMTLFFSRLTVDIKRLEGRAVAVVGGYRGRPLEITRGDEVGRLMEDVNHMQDELARSERQREISRQQHFHQEKMAAVGSLAAAVAHEISNPINSIAGIAQHTIDTIRSQRRLDDETLCGNADLTLKQSERIASIVRQIADLSAPRSPHPELLNVNELVKSTCSFIRYDKRFHQVNLIPDMDPALPAVRAVADHLTQVLMNLLINAADAMDGVAGRKPAIRVSTEQAPGEIVLSVSDNGSGMSGEVLAHAFDESFSTKPAGRGRGIGLYLCKALIEENHGRIDLASTPGVGTVARVHLPSPSPRAAPS